MRRLKSLLNDRGTSRDVESALCSEAGAGGIPSRAARTFGTSLQTKEMRYSAVVKNRDNQHSNPV